MEQETRMSNEEAVLILSSVRTIMKLYSAMTEEITQLIIANAQHGLDTIDSKLLLQIIARYVEQTKAISTEMR